MAKGNNYGTGTRDLAKAGKFAMNDAARGGEASYATAAAVGQRWQAFAAFAKGEGVKRLEGVTEQLVASYAQGIAATVKAGDRSPAYGQNLVSAVNSVMSLVTQGEWKSVSPSKDGGIAARDNVRTEAPHGLNRDDVTAVADALRSSGQARGAVILELARDLGLRSKEASLLNAQQALQEGSQRGWVTISEGTKGGRLREVPITHQNQLETLAKAAAIQGSHRSLVPASQTWAQWRAGGLRQAREALQAHGISRIHELRSAYAVERYQVITGQLPKMMGGNVDKAADRAARQVVAEELGHSRVAITVSYLGSMK